MVPLNLSRLNRRYALQLIATTAGLGLVKPSVGMATQPEDHKAESSKNMNFEIPGSLKAEHEELHEQLAQAIKAGGKTGEAAQAVAKVLHPHFVKEEQLAMPALGLLEALAAGRLPPDAAKIVKLTDELKRDLPEMIKEHGAIVVALDALAKAAQQENQSAAREFAKNLKEHAKTEEQVLYPAAILVGEYIKLKLKNSPR